MYKMIDLNTTNVSVQLEIYVPNASHHGYLNTTNVSVQLGEERVSRLLTD